MERKKRYQTIVRKGRVCYLKVCLGCGDEWYALPKQNRCSLCGSGLRRVFKGEDTTKAKDVQEGMNRANRVLLNKLPGWARQEILASSR